MWRLPGKSPWDELYLDSLGTLLDRLRPNDVRSRAARVPIHSSDFNRDAQIRRVTEFVQDVLNVDFTRPIFSGQRCGLVGAITGKTSTLDGKLASFAKETDTSKKDALAAEIAKALPTLFTDALKAKSSRKPAEEKLLTNLTDAAANAAAHKQAASNVLQKCNARLSQGDATAKKAALKDIMTYASHVRSVMRKDVVGKNGQDLLEGRGKDNKMVTDNIQDNPNALDPETCELTLGPNQVK
jgi:hypothetical protein